VGRTTFRPPAGITAVTVVPARRAHSDRFPRARREPGAAPCTCRPCSPGAAASRRAPARRSSPRDRLRSGAVRGRADARSSLARPHLPGTGDQRAPDDMCSHDSSFLRAISCVRSVRVPGALRSGKGAQVLRAHIQHPPADGSLPPKWISGEFFARIPSTESAWERKILHSGRRGSRTEGELRCA
jgi:hypothetical protein